MEIQQDSSSHTARPLAPAESSAGPGEMYQKRLNNLEAEARNWQKKHIWTGNARVGIFLIIVALWWKIARTGSPSIIWLVLVILGFIALAVLHRRILSSRTRAERAMAVYTRGLARIEDRWAGIGDKGDEFRDPDHLYADDLDIFGDGGLFQLLCVARTRMGKQQLAHWLLYPSPVLEVQDRHSAVLELKQKPDLREDLAVAGEGENINADPEKLRGWAGRDIDFNASLWIASGTLLATLTLAALVYAVFSYLRAGAAIWTPFLFLLLVNGLVMHRLRHAMEQLFANLDQACSNLHALSGIVRRIESEQFFSTRLQQLQKKLISGPEPASRAIARLGTLCDRENSRSNMVVQLLEFLLLYSVQVAGALQRWRKRYGSSVPAWLDAIGEMEALLSMGAYAYEHPQDPFPEFHAEGDACFAATALGHPLLSARNCVRNDVSLDRRNQVLLVSGSNMSGKSTLLRAAGINAVLAMMGAPVRADKLGLSPTAIGASMRVSDSLQKGVSHFYAEIKRIRQVVELSARGPLLFLFDEILQGTNSQDRRVGAEGILRTLIEHGALGMVTTHDLSITSIAEVFPDRVRNVHFQEKLEAGTLSFDYRMRPGVVTTHNGVELMRSVGLDV